MNAPASPLAVLRSPLEIRGRDGTHAVRFGNRVLLAPMEGVTDSVFRSLVLGLGDVGGATTEFQRISNHPLPARVFRRELGPPHSTTPTGVQLMAAGTEHLEETVRAAERAGAPWIDLNFGCPVPTVCGKGAGAALLDDPDAVGAIVAAAVAATPLPVSAKIRAGDRLREVVAACAEGGAAMLTVHARRRTDSYDDPADPAWISEAVAVWSARRHGAPLIGNGGVASADDAQALVRDTGCDGVMIGRAAIADPFVFRSIAGRPPPARAEAGRFVLDYLDAMDGARRGRALGRVKQLLRVYRAGGLFDGAAPRRASMLRARDTALVRRMLEDLASRPAAVSRP